MGMYTDDQLFHIKVYLEKLIKSEILNVSSDDFNRLAAAIEKHNDIETQKLALAKTVYQTGSHTYTPRR